MLTALNSNGIVVHIKNANSNEEYYCKICNQLLIQRRGKIKRHHFAHYSSHLQNYNYVPCTDDWQRHYDMSDWHMDWQNQFDVNNIERVVTIGNDKHIADALVGNVVVEFQHSQIPIKHFRERNDFYTNAGYKVIWVFDLIDEILNKDITVGHSQDNDFKWNNPANIFKKMDLDTEKAIIYIQTSDKEDEKVVERITDSYNEFRLFYTDHKNALTKTEFVNYVKGNSQLLFPKPKPPKAPDEIEGGKSIYNLWDDTYQWMIVKNLFNQKKMIIRGENGEMYREKYKANGRIVGKYIKFDNKDKKPVYENDFKVVYDAEKKIWSLEKSATDEALVEKKNKQIEENKKLEIENKKRIEQNKIEEEKRRKLFSYANLIPSSVKDGIMLSSIISSNTKIDRIIKNLYDGKYYYFCFKNNGGFKGDVQSINKYDYNTGEIGDMLTDEEEERIWAIKNKYIWEIIYD